ncbi:hypothetical protein FB567DRAFT_609813 [Paraphoma chrysanthemicola]|uniref:Uncharacterized protein n=1 Tax=Paraphoma chrysanthemicola TaxID=798071 RepID=A0A8K0RED5_9PLEO|nr:hypothetical protein FB567DRAFT_609813 [Paraphoma chrysanthemicola]
MSSNQSSRATLEYDDSTKRMRIGYTTGQAQEAGAEHWVCFVPYDGGPRFMNWMEQYSGRTTSHAVDLRSLEWTSRIKALDSSTTFEELAEDAYELWEAHFKSTKHSPGATVDHGTQTPTEWSSPGNLEEEFRVADEAASKGNNSRKRLADVHDPETAKGHNKRTAYDPDDDSDDPSDLASYLSKLKRRETSLASLYKIPSEVTINGYGETIFSVRLTESLETP